MGDKYNAIRDLNIKVKEGNNASKFSQNVTTIIVRTTI